MAGSTLQEVSLAALAGRPSYHILSGLSMLPTAGDCQKIKPRISALDASPRQSILRMESGADSQKLTMNILDRRTGGVAKIVLFSAFRKLATPYILAANAGFRCRCLSYAYAVYFGKPG